ncbi:heavy-metal-associated domain-containing protein [Deinococcus sp. Marseille-Q6407]|uniref:CopZ family metallochaperone n=1 Tax=Deinococcus sp. Marseille-Q6407 TaxID=2969223 RepID=UPI0021BED61B|nr:cation transporter [Deinococcus sp. Marseille-Q6407]
MTEMHSDQLTTLKIDGMSCGHCVTAVDKALRGVDGVQDVKVSLEEGRASVRGQADRAAMVAAVAEEGYTATPQD